MRTYIYIDGFNFYYGAVKDTPFKWLNFNSIKALMYKEVLKFELPWLNEVTRAKRPDKIPLVFSKNKIRKLLEQPN